MENKLWSTNGWKMTPKEMAEKMVNRYFFHAQFDGWKWEAKWMAEMAVDIIIERLVAKGDDERLAFELCGNQFYWQDVKKEIENL